jgi:demethylmenaquinone methyltransferase/2-methoxy-6-polyprenyl-1,4-benzoquinol methylase
MSDTSAPQDGVDERDRVGDEAQQQARARRSYDRLSHVYGMLSDSSEKRFVKDAIEELLRPEEGEVILEPGFGTGQALLALATGVGETGRVEGIDISDGMVAQARHRLEHHGLTDRIHLQVGSATDMPYAPATFDAVFMSFTLELFPDDQIPVVLAECARVLKPTGRMCVACMSGHGGNAAMEKLYEWSHEHFPSFVDCRPIDAPGALEAAGYAVTTVRPLTMWGLAVDLVLATPG